MIRAPRDGLDAFGRPRGATQIAEVPRPGESPNPIGQVPLRGVASTRSARFKVSVAMFVRYLTKSTGPVDSIAHLASPASPADYLVRPLETLAVGSRGTEAALRLAHAHNARFVLASTSEVYGDPLVHPQREDYWGNVNPVGTRSVSDEAKRFSEALAAAFHRTLGLDGPRHRPPGATSGCPLSAVRLSGLDRIRCPDSSKTSVRFRPYYTGFGC